MHHKLLITFILVGITTLTGIQVQAASEIRFGVHPFKKPNKIFHMFQPLVMDLEKRMGIPVKLIIGKSYADIINKHKRAEIDFGYFGPASFIKAQKATQITPLARIQMNGKGAFRGVILVNENSSIKNLSQLKGHNFAFGDPNSTLSHYVPHYMLLKAGIKLNMLGNYAFTGNHDNVALNIMYGNFDAGGLKPDVAKQYLKRGLRILAHSEWIPEHLFAANKHLEKGLRIKLRKALLKTDVRILQKIKPSISGIEVARSRDYDKLRKIIETVDKQDPPDKLRTTYR
ncbi:MAG: phosphate/phosphite/phosphonate ABC transporter substrate-binding protein [Gammaproteobacteria bacterium]|nr:phosphate/phosphite/phosphonate ABC transporter substrate-binding protein [Gammaproteobacteria bacterium]